MGDKKTQKRISYHKLIRDRIPEIIQHDGKVYEVEVMEEANYEKSLRDKLVEEAQEIATAAPSDLVTEIADLYEVLDTLMSMHQIEESTVKEVQKRRREKRGGFDKQLRLLWVEDPS